MSEQALTIEAPAVPAWRQPRVLDRIEQLGILLLWSWFILRVGEAHNPFAWLAALSETSVALFTLIRRPTSAISIRLGDWLLAMTATLAPMMIVFGASPWPQVMNLCIGLIVCGNLFQIWAKLTLRRSFGITAANRGVKRGGPYRLVRRIGQGGMAEVHLAVRYGASGFEKPVALKLLRREHRGRGELERLLIAEARLGALTALGDARVVDLQRGAPQPPDQLAGGQRSTRSIRQPKGRESTIHGRDCTAEPAPGAR